MPERVSSPRSKPPAGKGRKPAGGAKPKGSGFNSKVGGMPIWAWGALVLAAVGIGLYIRKRGGASTTAATAAPADTSGGSAAGDGTGSAFDPSGIEAEIAGLQSEIDKLNQPTPPGDTGQPTRHAKHNGATRTHVARVRPKPPRAKVTGRTHPHRPSKSQHHAVNTHHPTPHHPQAAALHEHPATHSPTRIGPQEARKKHPSRRRGRAR